MKLAEILHRLFVKSDTFCDEVGWHMLKIARSIVMKNSLLSGDTLQRLHRWSLGVDK